MILLFGGVLLSFISPKPSKDHWFYNEKRQLKADTNLYLDKRIPNSFFEDGLSGLYLEILPYVTAPESFMGSVHKDTIIFKIDIEKIEGGKGRERISGVSLVGITSPYHECYAELCDILSNNIVGLEIPFPSGNEMSGYYLYLPTRFEFDFLREDKFEPRYCKSIENGYLVIKANVRALIIY